MSIRKNTASARGGSLYGTQMTYSKRVLMMFCIFVFMWAIASFATFFAEFMATKGSRQYLLWVSVFQNIIWFGGTAVVSALFLSTRPMDMLGVNRFGSWLSVGGILLVYAVGIPFLNQVIWWNSQMHFPSFLISLENTLRAWEDAALDSTNLLLSGTSWSTLFINILTVGILTGVCEELVFRGTMQRIIGSGPIGVHLSIWITAVIFSIMHFQFFGFLPRVLLGAFFGYLFYWTGSIWIAATAHAINNSLYVLITWLMANGIHVANLNGVGVTTKGFPAIACVSLALTLFVLVGLRAVLFSTKKHG